ncbi:MAG TPA: hypothetical protein VFV81_03085 [Verrucomicrobiae bacterium]|nr:hypothetical protein [Verrucomicrobiae bacterium]
MKTSPLFAPRRSAFSVIGFGVASLALATTTARAQQALTDAIANDKSADARLQQEQSPDYTYKNGDFRMLLVPSLTLGWNDNVNLTQNNPISDFIITPAVGLSLSYPLSEQNLLQLNLNVGYSRYVSHDELSSLYLQSGSELSFDFYIKDILFNVHDRIGYEQDAAQNADIAGTGSYGNFQNTAGLSGQWAIKKTHFTLGYDHEDSLATTSQFSDTDLSSEMVYGLVGYELNSELMAGVEASGSMTRYRQNVLNDNNSYSGGVYADWRPGSFFRVQPRAGYVRYLFQNNSPNLKTSDLGTWYASVNVSHQAADWMSYSLEVGREVGLGLQADVNEDWYVRPAISWSFIKEFPFQTSLFFQHGKQGAGSTLLVPNQNLVGSETYDWYGGDIAVSHPITKQLTLGLDYRLTQRSSSLANRGYTQNLVSLQLVYHPK